MSDIFIFDIDGCIMPNEFQNFNDSIAEPDVLNPKLIDKVSTLHIFPEFFEFYKQYCSKNSTVYFITGRKRKDYRKITERQLLPLKDYKHYILKFYPDDKQHVKKEYLEWKIKIIYEILNQHDLTSNIFHIYDDFKDLIIELRDNKPPNKHIHCRLIQKQSDWKNLLNPFIFVENF